MPRSWWKPVTAASFRARAEVRIGEMTVAVDEVFGGFVLVVDDEDEQVSVSPSHRGTGIADACCARPSGWSMRAHTKQV